MIFKKYKYNTPSKRSTFQISPDFLNLNRNPFLKKDIKKIKKSLGKNNSGRITVFHKGGGVKKKYRKIDVFRKNRSLGIVCSIEYDPYRTSHLAAIFDFLNRTFFYILAPKGLTVGDIVGSGKIVGPDLGNSVPFTKIPKGVPIYNITLNETKGGQYTRSAGTFSVVKYKDEYTCVVELQSGKTVILPTTSFASIGEVSNEFHFLTKKGKAGRSRWLNKRPTVRGVAMNPIDHPHGGGEGKKSGSAKTPWGQRRK